MIGWGAAACITLAVALIAGATLTPPWRRRHQPAATAAAPEPDDRPTDRIPILTEPTPLVRTMFRRDELLWHKGAEDAEGEITLGLLAAAAGQLGVLMDVDGEAVGVRLDRHEVQGLRDALTCHLVASARSVTQ